jgi:hypothetical protein
MKPQITNEELSLFVGKKTGYYLKQWAIIAENNQPVSKMNLSALFLSLMWLFYRKMYLIGFLFFLSAVVVTEISDFILINMLGKAYTPKSYTSIMAMMFPAICSAFANKWYLLHAKRKISQIKQNILAEDLRQAAIKRKGGTNIVAGILFPILLFATSFVILVTIELLKKGRI